MLDKNKFLRKAIFDQLNRLETIKQKTELKNNNALKELKANVNVCLTLMDEVSGRKIGRRSNFKQINLSDYEKIAYKWAHYYRHCLINLNENDVIRLTSDEMDEIFKNLVASGMEGISQGIVKFTNQKKTALSTFIFNYAKFSVSKHYQKIVRECKKHIKSLNQKVNVEDSVELQDVLKSREGEVSTTVIARQTKQALNDVIAVMTEQEQLLLRLCSEHKLAEVSRMLQIPTRSIKKFLEVVRQKINTRIYTWC